LAKPWKVPGLRPRMPFLRAARRIIAAKYAEMMSYAAGAEAGDDEALHDMRIASKRLREGMGLLRACFPRGRANRVWRDANRLNDALGAVRDCDVFLGWLSEVEPNADVTELAALTRVAELASEERSEHLAALRDAFDDLLERELPRALAKLVGRRALARGGGAVG